MEDSVRVTVEFGDDNAPNMRTLVQYIRQHLIKEREELFVENDHMYVANLLTRRAGILVLINDSDWELEGEMDYELNPHDHIVFISTLHGG